MEQFPCHCLSCNKDFFSTNPCNFYCDGCLMKTESYTELQRMLTQAADLQQEQLARQQYTKPNFRGMNWSEFQQSLPPRVITIDQHNQAVKEIIEKKANMYRQAIKDLEFERDQYKIAAEEWMKKHDELKAKHEPSYGILTEYQASRDELHAYTIKKDKT